MTSVADHRAALASLDNWADYLTANSGLPGPRANLELVAACGEEADVAGARALVATDEVFQVMCGLVALGRLLGEGDREQGAVLRRYASDPNWRVREAVAMALQRAADEDPALSFGLAAEWAQDPDPLVRRAAVAAVAEPRLLEDEERARDALRLVAQVTADLDGSPANERDSDSVRVLRKALGYAWSVIIAALPEEGLPMFRDLEASTDPDIIWIVRENLKKARLRRLL